MITHRKQQRDLLEKLYERLGCKVVTISGARYVGKSNFISEFAKEKDAIVFCAQETVSSINLKFFTFATLLKTQSFFSAWEECFSRIAEIATDKKFILALDDFHYIAKDAEEVLVKVIEEQLKDKDILIIICDKRLNAMTEDEMNNHVLFGKRTEHITINEMNYIEARDLVSKFDVIDYLYLYLCIGGLPGYLAKLDHKKDFKENIADIYFSPDGVLYNEGYNFLRQEFRDFESYNAILYAVAMKKSVIKDIAALTKESPSKVSKYLDNLMKAQIVIREHSVDDDYEKSRKGRYRLANTFYYFWYRYVFPNKSFVQTGERERLIRLVYEDTSKFVLQIFQKVCFQHLEILDELGELPFKVKRKGALWNNKEIQFDIVFESEDGKKVIIGDCHWDDTKVTENTIDFLIRMAEYLESYDSVYYYIFSKSGFDEKCRVKAEKLGNIELIEVKEMFKDM